MVQGILMDVTTAFVVTVRVVKFKKKITSECQGTVREWFPSSLDWRQMSISLHSLTKHKTCCLRNKALSSNALFCSALAREIFDEIPGFSRAIKNQSDPISLDFSVRISCRCALEGKEQIPPFTHPCLLVYSRNSTYTFPLRIKISKVLFNCSFSRRVAVYSCSMPLLKLQLHQLPNGQR